MRLIKLIVLAQLSISPTIAVSQNLIYCGESVPFELDPQASVDPWTSETI